jgi:hypothetical protein
MPVMQQPLDMLVLLILQQRLERPLLRLVQADQVALQAQEGALGLLEVRELEALQVLRERVVLPELAVPNFERGGEKSPLYLL